MQVNSKSGRPKILYVEDQLDASKLVITILRDKFDVVPAATSLEAEEKLNIEKVDLILVDIALQKKFDGLDLIKKLKSDENLKNIPIIALTAYAIYGDKEKFLSQGADDYISKPFRKEQLIEKINRLIKTDR